MIGCDACFLSDFKVFPLQVIINESKRERRKHANKKCILVDNVVRLKGGVCRLLCDDDCEALLTFRQTK